MTQRRNVGGTMKVTFASMSSEAKVLTVRRAATIKDVLDEAGETGIELDDIRVNSKPVTSRTVIHPGDFITVLSKVAGGR